MSAACSFISCTALTSRGPLESCIRLLTTPAEMLTLLSSVAQCPHLVVDAAGRSALIGDIGEIHPTARMDVAGRARRLRPATRSSGALAAWPGPRKPSSWWNEFLFTLIFRASGILPMRTFKDLN